MDYDSDSSSSSRSSSSEDDAQQNTAPTTGLTLVLPSLSSLKAQPAVVETSTKPKKPKQRKKLYFTSQASLARKKRDPDGPKKQARPQKLKPLKEVLNRLIGQIKRCEALWFTSLDVC